MPSPMRLAVLFGGSSCEHPISLLSAAAILEAVDRTKYEVVPVGITRDGKWFTSVDPLGVLQALWEKGVAARDAGGAGYGDPPRAGSVLGLSVLDRVDVVFPVLHGRFGEDGTVQGLLELAQIPYVGAGVLASAIGMDKGIMKAIFQQAGLPVVHFKVLTRGEWQRGREKVLQELEGEFAYPLFTKPVSQGSSIGICKVHGRAELAPALDLACQYDRRIIIEQGVDGREMECALLGNEEPQVSVVGEIVVRREFYDYQAKYQPGLADLIIPAALPPSLSSRIQELALKAFAAIDCAGMARVDFFIERHSDRIYLNEINTIPGFTASSAYPKLWAASGLPFPRLIDRLVELALERHRHQPPSP